MDLIDRFAERRLLDGVLRDVRSGQSRVLVLHGDPGVGKSALMAYVARQASNCVVIRTAGVESEMELPYAALHQLCIPLLDRLDRLPGPQRDALGVAFGRSAGPAADRLVTGLAVLNLFCDVAEDRPLICLIDDFQWLDAASAQILAFLARRLLAESVALIIATRAVDSEMSKLPHMELQGLRAADARALLDAVWTAALDEQVRDQIVAETRGNPLALLELPRDLTDQELAGGFGLPSALRLSGRIEQSYVHRLAVLPEQTKRLLVVAAAEPTGDATLMWHAAYRIGISADAAAPAVSDGLVQFGPRVRFRHPLVRSAIYRSAPVEEIRIAHHALAEVTDPELDPDRRAWHRAQATDGPDEEVAAELERSADRAQARGGLAAAAAFLERATTLTLDPSRRAERALLAASAKVQAGAFDPALELLAVAETTPLSDFQHARTDLLLAQVAYVTGRGSDAPPLLLKAAERLETIDTPLSRTTYLDALQAAWIAGRLALGSGTSDVARAAQRSPKPQTPRLSDLVLDGFSKYFTDGYAAALPILRRAVGVARAGPPDVKHHFLVGIAAVHIWDDESWDALSARHAKLARTAGALTELPLALSSRAMMLLFAGQRAAAELLIQEAQLVTKATGDRFAADAAMTLLAFRGDQPALSTLLAATIGDVTRRGEGIFLSVAEFSQAVLYNGAGNHRAAMASAQRAAEHTDTDLVLPAWAEVELVEAAVRCGAVTTAADTVSRLSEMTRACDTDWALGIQARSNALISAGAEAEGLYREAVERLGDTHIRTELARTHLLFGEWLRRERRRTDARMHLHVAHDMFDAMGMEGFAERARGELLATGETARKRAAATTGPQLTPQEAQVARLACEGFTNPEIAGRLFISAKTVQYHLSKVFTKLQISSRSQLRQAFQRDLCSQEGVRAID